MSKPLKSILDRLDHRRRLYADSGVPNPKWIFELGGEIQAVRRGSDIISGRAATDCVHQILDGWAARYQILAGGSRQITGFLLPGDFCDLELLSLKRRDQRVCALSPCHVLRIDREHLETLSKREIELSFALQRKLSLEGARARAWIVNTGRRASPERIAHLLCELQVRLQLIGLATENQMPLRPTQQDLADATGLTEVHVNRVLRRLRTAELIALSNRILVIKNIAALQSLAGFDPLYLG